MKKNRIILAIAVGLLLLGFIPATQAKAIKRPLMDWIAINPVVGGWVSYYPDEGWGWIVRPHVTGVEYNPSGPPFWIWEYQGITECVFDGSLLQREMSGNRVMITATLHVQEVPVVLYPMGPPLFWIFEGIMDYYYEYKFVIDLDIWPDVLASYGVDPYDENGNVLLPPWYVPLFGNADYDWDPTSMGLELLSSHFVGSGEGVIVTDWMEWTADDEAKLKVNQLGITKSVFLDGWGYKENPNYYPPVLDPMDPAYFIYGQIWPVETISLH